MSFDIGDKVVYPHHGAAVIARREFRDIGDTSREYLVLHVDLLIVDDVADADAVDAVDRHAQGQAIEGRHGRE